LTSITGIKKFLVSEWTNSF